MRKTTSGFTIVELLIVIVVIGILAAITIVSFNGVQNKAKSAKKSSDVVAIQKKMEVYKAINSSYPSTPASAKTNADFGGINASIYAGGDSRYDCDSAGTVTKDNYCLFGDADGYGIIWWDYASNTWKGYETNADWTSNDNYGSGSLPSIPG